ncbi:hypothetical protein CERZMDRAFT_102134 [Cercospora zeae-maydis SCOH1-5]|uniref:Uncharacterized protein n=1 Tax=Cercospora zeae-maydis SCOH1-5 TaxID=717836 RepID=A0A6A6EZJ7_9PEZI|nr:hypothetical protein CERZMDRAFT_102134 [Cercospora zeae-maydis SCOH1-5]
MTATPLSKMDARLACDPSNSTVDHRGTLESQAHQIRRMFITGDITTNSWSATTACPTSCPATKLLSAISVSSSASLASIVGAATAQPASCSVRITAAATHIMTLPLCSMASRGGPYCQLGRLTPYSSKARIASKTFQHGLCNGQESPFVLDPQSMSCGPKLQQEKYLVNDSSASRSLTSSMLTAFVPQSKKRPRLPQRLVSKTNPFRITNWPGEVRRVPVAGGETVYYSLAACKHRTCIECALIIRLSSKSGSCFECGKDSDDVWFTPSPESITNALEAASPTGGVQVISAVDAAGSGAYVQVLFADELPEKYTHWLLSKLAYGVTYGRALNTKRSHTIMLRKNTATKQFSGSVASLVGSLAVGSAIAAMIAEMRNSVSSMNARDPNSETKLIVDDVEASSVSCAKG